MPGRACELDVIKNENYCHDFEHPLLAMASRATKQKEKRPVSPEHLTALINNEANRIVVTESPMKDAKLLFESKKEKDLKALAKALVATRPDEWFHCMCIGTPAIYIYKDKKLLTLVTNHHGQSVRCSLWDSDAPIAEIENWLKWFDDRKIKEPRREVHEMQARREQSRRDWKKWVAAIPKGIEPIWKDSLGQFGDIDTTLLLKALHTAVPKKDEQILALLEWFGSGAGPWSGSPSYESTAEELLLKYQLEEIVSVVDPEKLTPVQTEGAARLFGGWDFYQKHPQGLKQLPDEIKRALWNHVKDTEDEDKLGRATQAFRRKR